jgi:ribosomal protein S12 methylthiotransferase
MRRPHNISRVRRTLSNVRSKVENATLRSTFIVGYPGEDERAFQNLVNFINEVEFDHLGAFKYSFERGSPAEPLGDPIPEHTKIERMEVLMQQQAEISLRRNQKFIGKTLDVLIEGVDEESQIAIGRSFRDAPEIDGLAVVEGIARIGDMVPVNIHSAITHDLIGEISESHPS